MTVRLAAATMSLLGVAACATAPVAVSDQGPDCTPLKANVQFSCWAGGDGAPASHCVLIGEAPEGCQLLERAMAYLYRGSPTHFSPELHPEGTWFRMVVHEDSEGRVGIKGVQSDGEELLVHHDQSPLPASLDPGLPPKWPRWPAGLEIGPEQLERD